MKKLFTIILLGVATFALAHPTNESMIKSATTRLSFTRNDGQVDTKGKADCRFVTDVGGGKFYFCADGVVEDFQKRVEDEQEQENVARVFNPHADRPDIHRGATKVIGHVLKLNFLGRTNFITEVNGEEEQEYKCNYFIGNDKTKWHTNVPNYSRLVYRDVWKGIDVAYYGDVARAVSSQTASQTARATLKYDVILHPGASPNQIQFAYQGENALSTDNNGALVIKTSLGDVIEQKPYVYQMIDGKRKEIASQFILTRNVRTTVAFAIGDYDNTKDLVIDPAVYSTLLESIDSRGFGIAVDAGGNAYITGSTTSSNFPTTLGAYQDTLKGGFDVFVTKVNPSGSALAYSTYLGGSAQDYGQGIAVDAGGNAYITGYTASFDFPTTLLAYQIIKKPGSESATTYVAFLTKLKPNGDSLAFSTYLGGSVADIACAVVVDSAGSAFVTGRTQSPDFPFTLGAYQTALKGYQNAFVTKFDPSGTKLLYSTFLGGEARSVNVVFPATGGQGIALDRNDNAYITGSTNCSDFPVKQGAFQLEYRGGGDAFVTKVNPSGSALGYSTYLGGSSSEFGYGIAVDTGGNAYVTGYTSSSDDFPTTWGAYQRTFNVNGYIGYSDAFVTKLNPSGSTLAYSTYLGGSNQDYGGYGIAVDVASNAYITGSTLSSDFPTTPGAYQTKFNGYSDAFVTKLNPSGSALAYSTYLGGSNQDFGQGIAVDAQENAYVVGHTQSKNFPTTSGAYQTTDKGGQHAFVTKFALVPAITVTDTLNFDSVLCTEDQTILLIENLADVVLKIDTMTITGPNSTNFSFGNLPKFPLVISHRDSAQIILQLTRKGAAGKKTAALNIHSNDNAPLSDTLRKVTLTGVIDSVGVLTLEKNITFGNLRCEEVSYDTVVRVKNTGLQSVTIVPTVSGQNATSFTVTPAGTTVPTGGIGKFNVHFQPSGKGSSTAHIQFSSNDCGMIFDTTYVKGSKISSVSLSSYPSFLDFGEQCHSTVVDSFITVYNKDSGTVTLDPPVETGNGFTVTPNTSVTLVAGDSIRYHVGFISSGAGSYQGTITIGGKPCNINVSLQLRGTEVEPPKITLKPATVFFDTLDCNETERFTQVKVRNIGSRTITIKPVVTGDTASYHIKPDTAFVLHANEFRNVTITFHPDSGRQKRANLFFADPLCGLLKDSVTLSGFKPFDAISGKPLSLRFDTMDCSYGQRDTMSIWIKNIGDQTLNLNPPTVSGNKFTIENRFGVLGLAPGDSTEPPYRIIFYTDYNEGTYLDTFRITGPCNTSFTCPLVGVCSIPNDVENSGIESARGMFLGQNYPNPFTQLSVVSCQLSVARGQSAKFEIRDMLGRVVYQTNAPSTTTQFTIDASDLPNGLYLYSLTDGVTIRSRMMMVMK